MLTTLPFLRIEKEYPSELILVSANRRWIILLATLFLSFPIVGIGILLLLQAETMLIGIASIVFGMILLYAILLFSPFQSHLTVNLSMRSFTLNRAYWLGFGAMENNREKSWSFVDFADANLVSRGWKKWVELEKNGKKVLLLDFGSKGTDAQRAYSLIQSWIKGLPADSSTAVTTLETIASEKQKKETLKNAEKLLFYFGIFSLIDGAFGLFTDSVLATGFSILTTIKFLTGIIYLACAFGTKRRFETALWIAIVVVLAERLYWFIQTMSLGNGSWSTWLTWIFAIFVLSSLWSAIRSIRAVEEEPVFEPLV